ncbi:MULTISPECIES: L-aspartate oxidase [unclassified Nitratiruptor]|uniref:L-aspartate oxidase n=1 Tax=unclassified Nitratiruptor TaxID=2624044 RepID=UPI00191653E8|nr:MULTISPECIES: L-aspartate oxidase [unclassified Nitratiruptor]BCD60648.1 L-aspartate oxidase [Nitratiruptor sp. YY08-10]BCD64579.1 L-aspartate oxidase [Nitratiruptor sp. YY08-14]
MKRYDYLIVGAGIAGLYAALNVPKECSVLILSKDPIWECNTFYAQGGVATAVNEEDIPLHIQDTLQSGAGLCNEEAVEILSRNSMLVIEDLIARGFAFDTDEHGNLLFTKEAAHSRARILHAGGDATGRELHRFLLSQVQAKVLEGVFVLDLLIEDNIVYGVTVQNGENRHNIYAKNIIIASGGIGSLYEYHTNAKRISADIQGLASLKGLPLKDMEFTQFHPTVFVYNVRARKLLLTEALRGEGATVVDETGRRFLFEYDERGELAPRDIVSRAIYRHQKEGHSVYLDFSNFTEKFFQKRFPNIYRVFRNIGYNVPYDRVPISPAFHFMMGGIETDTWGKVKGYENLYAVGEVACTGVHGANRLASNSLLEGLVFSKRAIEDTLFREQVFAHKEFPVFSDILVQSNDKEIKQQLRHLMWHNVGIIRKRKELQEAKEQIDSMKQKDIGYLLRLRISCAEAIVDAALARRKSVGAHYIEEGE